MRITRTRVTVAASLVVLVGAAVGLVACSSDSPAQSEHDKALSAMTNDLEHPLTKRFPVAPDGITIVTTYTTGYKTTDWQITSNKTLNIRLTVEVPKEAGAVEVLMEHMHADVSLISDNQTLNGWPQDSMDSSIHGGTQAGFVVDAAHGFNVVFSVEGYSQSLISGWGYAVGGYGSVEIKEQRLTENHLRGDGKVKGNKVVIVWVVLIKGPKDAGFHEVSFADEFQVPVG